MDFLKSTEKSELLSKTLNSVLPVNPSFYFSLSPFPCFLDGFGDSMPPCILLVWTLALLNSSWRFLLVWLVCRLCIVVNFLKQKVCFFRTGGWMALSGTRHLLFLAPFTAPQSWLFCQLSAVYVSPFAQLVDLDDLDINIPFLIYHRL